ncbi:MULTISPECIES: transposase [Weissella]|uniref:Transposase n=1 Tax=Weissella fermenti TaxID=2987699 RepID=A0ABT6D437_9LACO|nr:MULTISPECIES: transposase [unclassified Weissella]MCW0926159.1 transposase [Weissella sp. LMG 11983]MDF9300290.1 transposase [Weissella sp. BK2]
MFSKEIQIEAVSLYLKGVPTVEIRKKFGIKGSSTLGIWVDSIKRDGVYGIKDSHRKQTSYPYSGSDVKTPDLFLEPARARTTKIFQNDLISYRFWVIF